MGIHKVLKGYDYVNCPEYLKDLEKRDKKIETPTFKNEREFGYVITNEFELEKLRKYIKKLNPLVRAFDTETQGEDDNIRKARMVGFSISFGREKHQNFYIPCGHTILEPYGEQVMIDKLMGFIEEVLLQPRTIIAGHNVVYDQHILANHGLHLIRYTRKKNVAIYDTMIASWTVDENQLKGLKEQSRMRLRHRPYVPKMMTYNETVGTVPTEVKRKHGLKPNQKATIDLVSLDVGGDYAINDSLAVFDLIPIYEEIMLKEAPSWERYHYFEMEYYYVAYKMERRGVRINLPLLKQYKKKIVRHIRSLEKELYDLVGYSFSVRSTKALPNLLYNELGFPVEHFTDPTKNKSGTSNPSTGKEALETMLDYRRTLLNPMLEKIKKLEKKRKPTKADKLKLKRLKREAGELERKLHIVKLIEDIRLLRHLDSNFITGLLEKHINGIIYPRFNVTGTVSGRLSSSQPNGQNIINDVKDIDPRYEYSIRDLFIARKGHKLVVSDESNLELRVLAQLTKDKRLIHMFLNGEDPHSSTAIDMNTNHRLVKMGITPAELKTLDGIDKYLYKFTEKNLHTIVEDEKEYKLLNTYFYEEEELSTVIKKSGAKEALKLLWRLAKEGKDLRSEGKLLNFA